jgi:hypothetical protein
LNTWVSFQSAEQPLLGQFSVSGNTPAAISASRCKSVAWEPSAFDTRM